MTASETNGAVGQPSGSAADDLFRQTGRAEIGRVFLALLDRRPTAFELDRCVKQPLADVVLDIAQAPEFQERFGRVTQEAIARISRAMLGRDPDAMMFQAWAGGSQIELIEQLVRSPEFQTRWRTARSADVVQAYGAVLGRNPSSDETDAWIGQPIAVLYGTLGKSAEFQTRSRTVVAEVSLMYEAIAKSVEFARRHASSALPLTTVRPSQLDPPVENLDQRSISHEPTEMSDAFRAFAAAYPRSLSDLNQYGVSYAAELFALFEGLVDHKTRCIVEFGSGFSTLILQELLFGQAERVEELIFLSIDHNQDWQRRVARALPLRAFTHLRTVDLVGECETTNDSGFNHATAPQLLQHKVDVAFVDGRTRAQSVLAIATCLNTGGAIILDDAGREGYQFLDQHFKQADTRGRFKIFRHPILERRAENEPASAERRAILRVISGRQAEIEATISRASLEAYAHRCDAELVDVKVEESDAQFSLAKLGLADHLARYDRVLLVDCDLIVRRNTPDLFRLVPSTHIGAVREDRYVDRSDWLGLMSDLYDVPIAVAETSPYFNSGVLLLSRQHYDLLKPRAGTTIFAHPLFEQTFLNARLRELEFSLYELPKEFNYIPQYDAKFALDWRFGSIIHLAGGQELVTDSWQRHDFWEELPYRDGIRVRRQSKLLFRHVRVPYLRALADAIEHGHDYRIVTAPDLEFRNSRRLLYMPQHGVLGVDLTGAPDEMIASARIRSLGAKRYRGELRLIGAEAGREPVRFELVSADGARIADASSNVSDDTLVVAFEVHNSVDGNIEFRIWGREACFFESLTLIAEPEE